MMAMMRLMMRDARVPMMMGRPRRSDTSAGRDRDRASQNRHTTFYKSHQINPLVDFLIERFFPRVDGLFQIVSEARTCRICVWWKVFSCG